MLIVSNKLYEYLLELDKAVVLEIMGEALDMMQSYNGRSQTFCIISSIPGATVTETDDGYEYKLPTKEIA